MKTKILLLSIILILFSTAVFAQKQTPSEFVQSFYKFHRARSGVIDAKEVEAHKKWFTTELIRLFQYELEREAEFSKENPTDKPHYGDGFPFSPMKECYKKGKEIKNTLKIGKTSVRRNKTFVKVSFYYPKVCEGGLIHSYKLELVKNKGGWLINDLIFLDDESGVEDERLTDDLKREKY